MKYWIFQSNQVMGPYEPDDLGRHSAFSAESLVCPEGRRGTSMGDWQRAGMVPDLSVALVRASQSQSAPGSVTALLGLPPEPTLKDLAVLGSLQEKVAMLEDVVIQLQEGLRVKDSELAALHQELAGKEVQSTAIKSALETEAAQLKRETDERRNEAEALKGEAAAFKRKIAELEERLGAVNRLGETIDKAVEAEKHVERDVETQGATIAELSKEIEALRVKLAESMAAAASAPPPAPPPAAAAPAPTPFPAPAGDLPVSLPPPPVAAPVPTPIPGAEPQAPAPFPAAEAPLPMPINPMSPPEPAPAPAPVGVDDAVPEPAKPAGRKKAVLFGVLAGLLALGAAAMFMPGLLGGGKKKPAALEPVAAPPPAPTPVAEAPAPVSAPVAPEPDPRQSAIDAAKSWPVPGGKTLGETLETLSPPAGNLSPWMAEPLADKRVSVNYFAHGAPGSPTVAYEFEVDLAAKTVAGRNAAAKAVIAGKAATPPAPPKAKQVKVRAKKKAEAAPAAPAADAPKKEESLDSLLGAPQSAPEAKPAPAPKPAAAAPSEAPGGDSPGEEPPAQEAPVEKPAKPAKSPAKRAAKAAKSAASADAKGGKAADEALLDDLLKE